VANQQESLMRADYFAKAWPIDHVQVEAMSFEL
jgi:hypothetical protein